MMWYTHAVVGANVVWLFTMTSQPLETGAIPVFMAAGAFTALLPDLDATAAKIHYVGGGIFRAFSGGLGNGLLRHRGLLHSVPIALVVYVSGLIFLRSLHPLLPPITALAYFSHSFVDGFNRGGVGYWFPLSQKYYHLAPKILRTPVKGMLDRVLLVGGTCGVIGLLFVYAYR